MSEPDLLLRGLGDPTRRALFETLCREGPLSVRALTDGAAISQPAVSKHLAVLREAGLVRPEARGREVHYHADPAALAPLTDWAARMAGFWQGRLDAFEELLKRMDQ